MHIVIGMTTVAIDSFGMQNKKAELALEKKIIYYSNMEGLNLKQELAIP